MWQVNRRRWSLGYDSLPIGPRDNGPVPQLMPPDPRVRASFAKVMDEFRAEGRGMADDHSEIGDYLRDRHEGWSSDEALRVVTEVVRAQRLGQTPRPVGYVSGTELLVGRPRRVPWSRRHPPSTDAGPPGGGRPHRLTTSGLRQDAKATLPRC